MFQLEIIPIEMFIVFSIEKYRKLHYINTIRHQEEIAFFRRPLI